MKKSLFSVALLMQVVLFLIFSFTGCTFFIEKPEPEEIYTDENGNVCYVVNKNHFKFDTYNTVEVVISDEERFILYDIEDDDAENGFGEWIKGNFSIPIYFSEYSYGDTSYKHTDIVIFSDQYDVYYAGGADDYPHIIAKIHNDVGDPRLYWCTTSNNYFPYRDEYGEEVSVEYKMYEGNFGESSYVPERARDFYRSIGTYSCAELELEFDSTGNGMWTLNDTTYPVIVSFNEELFSFSVRYNTTDERDGYLIFSGEGTEISVNEASYNITFKPNNTYDDTLTHLTIVKSN